MWLLFALSQAPVVILFAYVYFRDRTDREPIAVLGKTFALGAICCFPAGFIETWLDVPTSPKQTDPVTLFFAILFGIAFVEESFKYLTLRYYAYTRPAFNEPYDGIMYGVAASLGFAALENLMYALLYGAGTAILRMFTAVPMHAATGVLMGYNVGRAKYAELPEKRSQLLRRGFGVATLFHGTYNYFFFMQSPLLVFFGLACLGYQVRLARRAIKEYAHVPPKVVITEAVRPPPPPSPADRPAEPPRLSWVIRPLQFSGISAVLGFFFCLYAIVTMSGEMNPQEKQAFGVAVVGFGVISQILMFIVRSLRRASRFGWLLALGAYILFCGTPLFIVGIVGLAGLLHPETREFFWGEIQNAGERSNLQGRKV